MKFHTIEVEHLWWMYPANRLLLLLNVERTHLTSPG